MSALADAAAALATGNLAAAAPKVKSADISALLPPSRPPAAAPSR
jgi:hypothetical protein